MHKCIAIDHRHSRYNTNPPTAKSLEYCTSIDYYQTIAISLLTTLEEMKLETPHKLKSSRYMPIPEGGILLLVRRIITQIITKSLC